MIIVGGVAPFLKVSDPDHPFSFGVTLEEVSAQTTDSNYKEKVIKESVERIYKVWHYDLIDLHPY